MSDDICGVTTTDDTPCQNPAGENGYCWIPSHNPGSDDENPHGRPTKLSKERQEKIAAALEAGKSMTIAARKVGVSRNAVYSWLDRGETEKEAGKDNEYTDFYDRITRARGAGEEFYFNLALDLAMENEDHRFIASLMKQRYPESWAGGEEADGVNDEPSTVINIPESVTEEWVEHR